MKQSDSIPLRCHVDVPPRHVPAARYALETLLRPLSLSPVWTSGETDLYYGPQPGSASPITILTGEKTWAFYDERRPYESSQVIHTDTAPVLFGSDEAPDMVASAFFFLSGWEEHALTPRDEHGRFCAAHSLQASLGCISTPLVDHYRDMLADRLQHAGVAVRRRSWNGSTWAFLPTFDVDYLREWRPGTLRQRGWRQPLRVLRSVMTGADAYRDGLHQLLAVLSEQGATGTFFFKGGDRSAYDPSYRRSDAELSRLLDMVNEQGSETGLHPGYHAATHADYLQDERDRLHALSGATTRAVRQHYLRYYLPLTSRLQERAGFKIDSTLGFADHEGFRRGTCVPFQLFDPVERAVLDLWEMPLCFMDSAMVARRGMTASDAATALAALMQTCREVGGACVVLWHNTLWQPGMGGWPEMMADALTSARESGAYIGSLGDALRAWSPESV